MSQSILCIYLPSIWTGLSQNLRMANWILINVSAVNPFDPHGDIATVYQRWVQWLQSFELFADASGCVDPVQKRQLLLHCVGADTQDIFFTLDPVPLVYAEAKTALLNYFKPTKNLPYLRHQFRQARQVEDESIAQFVTRFRLLATDYEFNDNLDDFIRDQVIDKCSSTQLRTKLVAIIG